MPQRSLFSILTEQPWWVSLLAAAAVYSIGALFSPVVGAAAAFPFFCVTGYIGWLRIRRGPALDTPALLKALRGAAPEDLRAMLAEAYATERYQVVEGGGEDLELQRNGYLTLVRYRRWRAQSTGGGALDELAAAMRKRNADHGVYVTAGAVSEGARRRAGETDIALLDGPALAALVRRTRGARKALQRAAQEAAQS